MKVVVQSSSLIFTLLSIVLNVPITRVKRKPVGREETRREASRVTRLVASRSKKDSYGHLAPVRIGSPAPEVSHDSPGCIYSFDLNGNVVEMNAAMADVLGYAREEAARMNLGQLLEPESWKRSREQILLQLGGGGLQQLSLTAIARDGSLVRLAVVRRLLFERGRPVAVQDAGRVLADHAPVSSRLYDNSNTRSQASPSRFAEQLKQLHRLSTTSYVALEQALEDHLETGCRTFPSARGRLASSGRLP